MDKRWATDLVDFSRRYFLSTADRESYAWIFSEDELPDFERPLTPPPRFLRSSHRFGPEQAPIYVIHQFASHMPILLSYEAFTNELQIPFRPTAIMDSNIVNYLHQYVISESRMDPLRRAAVVDFLCFAITNEVDYNPFFYYMEGATKDLNGRIMSYASSISESILRLHTMDDKRFLATGEIVVNPVTLSKYAEEYGADSIEEIAPRYARAMTRSDPYLDALGTLTYASLLKMGLVHRRHRGAIIAKYNELLSFMQNVLNVGMGPERILALGYFAGQHDRLIPIQRGARPDRLLRQLRATAWDILLTRLPARLLGTPFQDEVVLGYVCTGDRALKQIAELCRVEAVMAIDPTRGGPLPIFSFDQTMLKQIVGDTALDEIMERDREWGKSRVPYLSSAPKRISYDELKTLVSGLEAEVVEFCQS